MSQEKNFPDQKPSAMPVHRYSSFIPVDLKDRTWPTKQMSKAPHGALLICVMAIKR